MSYQIAVVHLTWQRIPNLRKVLAQLNNQTYKDFDVYISNANTDEKEIAVIKAYIDRFPKLRVKLINTNNDLYTFRRIVLSRDLAISGYDIILFIDDDVTLSYTHIEKCIEQYEPKTYKSGYAWSFFKSGQSYYRYRKRQKDNSKEIHYCGTGMAMIDASIFLENGIFDYPEGALKIEDLWLSYYAHNIMGWKLMYMDTGGSLVSGRDDVALFKQVQQDEINKDIFLKRLVDMGWQIPESI